MISDATIQRVDLQGLCDSIKWSDDGTIAVNTMGALTILKPKYQKEDVKSANDLFEVQKLDIESWPRNQLYQVEAEDEVTSTVFSSTDDFVTKLLWSPLTPNREVFLAVLTGSKSLHILKDGLIKLTIGSYASLESQSEINDAMSYSFEWLEADNELYFITGQASGNLKLYKCEEDKFRDLHTIELTKNIPIVQLKAQSDYLIAVSAENEILLVDDFLSEKKLKVKTLKTEDRQMVYDIYLANTAVLFSTPSKFHKIDVETGSTLEILTNIYEFSKIIPNGSGYVLISNTKSLQIDSQLTVVNDDLIALARRKRINRRNSMLDSFSVKNTTLKVYGADYNFSGDVLAIIYEIENETGFKYSITSENLYKIAFIPLENRFESGGSSLAIYQEFALSGKIPSTKVETTIKKITEKQTLDDFLKTNILRDPEITKLIAVNIISRDKDSEIRARYCKLLIDFVKQNNLSFSNAFDQTTYKYLLNAIGEDFNGKVGTINVASDVFEETFVIDDNNDPETLVSETNHKWNRCALTFLPIVSTGVKIDPVTERRIIDISKDELNNYGFFTRAILTSLNEVCLYSGCRFESKS